jgi:hypothetical protein
MRSPHSCYMAWSSHPPLLDPSNYIWRSVQVLPNLEPYFYIGCSETQSTWYVGHHLVYCTSPSDV